MEAVKGRLRDLRILIVDDDKDTRAMLRFVLEQEAGQVIAASTVGKALEEYKRLSPNVVVADIGMPGDCSEFSGKRDDVHVAPAFAPLSSRRKVRRLTFTQVLGKTSINQSCQVCGFRHFPPSGCHVVAAKGDL